MSTLFRGALHNRKAGMADDELFIYNTFLSHIPEPETVCSTLIPTCHEDYATKKHNCTETCKCFECAACNTLSIALMVMNFRNLNFIYQINYFSKKSSTKIFGMLGEKPLQKMFFLISVTKCAWSILLKVTPSITVTNRLVRTSWFSNSILFLTS